MRSWKLLLLFSGIALVLAGAFDAASFAEVNVNVGINVPLPVYVAPAPPPVVVIPNSYVYYVPNIEVDVLFYHGYWYRPHGAYWYRSSSYNGPWHHMAPRSVPHALVSLPPNYRHMPPGHQHIPYGQLKKNWSRWERDRYWYHNDWGRKGGHGGPGRGHKGRRPEGRGHDDDRGGHGGNGKQGNGHGGHGGGHGR